MAESKGQKDVWDKAGILGQILLPVVIAVVGIAFSIHQAGVTEERDKVLRVLNFLEPITSENQQLKAISLVALQEMYSKNYIDANFFGTINKTITLTDINGEDTKNSNEGKIENVDVLKQTDNIEAEKLTDEALGKFAKVTDEGGAKNNEEIVKIQQSAIDKLQARAKSDDSRIAISANKTLIDIGEEKPDLKPRVYLHIKGEDSLKKAEELKASLIKKGFIVPRINQVKTAPVETDFRYFKDSQEGDIKAILEILNKQNIIPEQKNLTALFPNANVRPRHYEIWFSSEK